MSVDRKKYYVVWDGRTPGIYDSFDGYHRQTHGYPKAKGKSFIGRAAAEEAFNISYYEYSKRSLTCEKYSYKNPYEKFRDHRCFIERGGVVVYSDGSCHNNNEIKDKPSVGGYGAVILDEFGEHEISGSFYETTSSRMELFAVIKSLEYIEGCHKKVQIYTDYKSIADIMKTYSSKETHSNSPNNDLWERLKAISQKHEVAFHWVKGHYGIDGNVKADRLAKKASKKANELDNYISVGFTIDGVEKDIRLRSCGSFSVRAGGDIHSSVEDIVIESISNSKEIEPSLEIL